jgi:hypothetical protein
MGRRMCGGRERARGLVRGERITGGWRRLLPLAPLLKKWLMPRRDCAKKSGEKEGVTQRRNGAKRRKAQDDKPRAMGAEAEVLAFDGAWCSACRPSTDAWTPSRDWQLRRLHRSSQPKQFRPTRILRKSISGICLRNRAKCPGATFNNHMVLTGAVRDDNVLL